MGSFLALSVFALPFPVVIAIAALIGWILGRTSPEALQGPAKTTATETDEKPPLTSDDILHTERPTPRRTLLVLAIGIVVWGVPVLAFALLTSTDSVFTTQGLFFAGTALVTFGGAYVVLAYVAQRAVEVLG
ncbi:hypothetical protein [uncultured Gordonia sp.]|uniref:hypothetical protein n=1 Tax=uncultured Gordonia sp. TaxID=198437 RepID=UPI002587EEF8|nr:hypothetical protein [uncultured Gordonia sp.]